jgi:glycosyl transferase family 25
MLLDNLLPHKICINLDRRAGRWERMQAEFARHGIDNVRRFSACDGNALVLPPHWQHTAGAYGCLLSHLQVVQAARELDHESVLIFEDDAVFDPEFTTKFASFAGEVPADWDMLYFGALHKDEPVQVSDHVYRITKANSTYAYALKRTVFDAFVELNARAADVLDMNAYELQERFHCYCFMPHLAWVESEYSDVQNRLERHWYLEKSLVLFGAHVDRLLSETAIVIAHHGSLDENARFLERYYREYFAPLARVVLCDDFKTGISNSDSKTRFFLLTDSDLYLETLDVRANLLMCEPLNPLTHEQFDGATGFSHVIDLTAEQARLLRATGMTRGIDVSKITPAKNVRSLCRFVRREALEATLSALTSDDARLFQSPNHALRLPR